MQQHHAQLTAHCSKFQRIVLEQQVMQRLKKVGAGLMVLVASLPQQATAALSADSTLCIAEHCEQTAGVCTACACRRQPCVHSSEQVCHCQQQVSHQLHGPVLERLLQQQCKLLPECCSVWTQHLLHWDCHSNGYFTQSECSNDGPECLLVRFFAGSLEL